MLHLLYVVILRKVILYRIDNYSSTFVYYILTYHKCLCVLVLKSLVRGGIAVEVILEYEMEGLGDGRMCITCAGLQVHRCVTAKDGWPNNRIELYAWYQWRAIKMCRGRLWGWSFVSADLLSYHCHSYSNYG